MVRRGRDLHLHGQVFVAPEGTLATVTAASGRPFVRQQYERCGVQIHDLNALSGAACWCHVISYPCRFLLSTIAFRSLPILAPLLVLLGEQFSPLQLGGF